MVCSKSIANFEFPRVTYIRFFVALCWYSYSSLTPTSSAILNVRLIFDSYFAWACFGSSSISPKNSSKKWIEESVSKFQGGTVNKKYYLQVMRNLSEAIRQNRPDLWKNKNWLLHHNAPTHTSLLVREFLAKKTIMLPQPLYSPDLAPVHFSCSQN